MQVRLIQNPKKLRPPRRAKIQCAVTVNSRVMMPILPVRVTIDQDQGCIYHTVSASILSYKANIFNCFGISMTQTTVLVPLDMPGELTSLLLQRN
jgi:hypothetical protein